VDLPATAAALVGQKLSAPAAPDSFNSIAHLAGSAKCAPARDHLVVMSGKGDLAIRQGPWKYIPDLHTANGWQSVARKAGAAAAGPGLFNLTDDPGETKNLNPQASRSSGTSRRIAEES
jgi:arylsulfatase A-like enzyme